MKNSFSLTITLWISMILISGSLFFIKISKENLGHTSQLMEKLNNDFKNDSNLELLKFYLGTGKSSNNLVINSNLSELGLQDEIRVDNEEILFNGSKIRVQDAAGLINLFYINEEVLERLLENKKVLDRYIAIDSLSDWIDNDIFPKLNGAEFDYYKFQAFQYVPRNYKLFFIDELKNIKGWENIYNEIKDNFVYAPAVRYNSTTMNENVLSAMFGIPLETADKLVTLKDDKNIRIFNSEFRTIYKINYDPLSILYRNYTSNTFKIEIKSETQSTTSLKKEVVDLNNFILLYYFH